MNQYQSIDGHSVSGTSVGSLSEAEGVPEPTRTWGQFFQYKIKQVTSLGSYFPSFSLPKFSFPQWKVPNFSSWVSGFSTSKNTKTAPTDRSNTTVELRYVDHSSAKAITPIPKETVKQKLKKGTNLCTQALQLTNHLEQLKISTEEYEKLFSLIETLNKAIEGLSLFNGPSDAILNRPQGTKKYNTAVSAFDTAYKNLENTFNRLQHLALNQNRKQKFS
ncbi:MAG: hypothetical protein K2W99_04715 [Chthoniobacterales bacterium]|nr:hypothetical protein [Chthoniobacterales bacterium]